MKRIMVCMVAMILVGVLFSINTFPLLADENDKNISSISNNELVADNYKQYINSVENPRYPEKSIEVLAESASLSNGTVFEDVDNKKTVLFGKENSTAIFDFKIEEAGLYNIAFDYKTVAKENNIAALEIDVSIDGKKHDWLKSIRLERLWEDDGDIVTDKDGNDVAPAQKECNIWINSALYDSQQSDVAPLYYYFDEGEHYISVSSIRGEFYLSRINIYNLAEPKSYSEVMQSYPQNKSTKDFIQVIEAEEYTYKSSFGIIPENDPSNAATSPNSPTHTKLNHISGSKFKETGSFVEWEIDVPQNGFYCMDMRVRQNYNSGLNSMRKLTIDGICPFKECEDISFEYQGNWYIKGLGEEEPYLFYLTKGKHTLRLTAVKGSLTDEITASEELIYKLNDLYSNIVMVVGVNPDKYRDYKLEEEIPGIKDRIVDLYTELVSIQKGIKDESGGKSGNALTAIHTLLNLLDTVKKNPDKLCLRLDDLRDGVESFAAWVNNLDEQPLDIDYIRLYSPDTSISDGNVGFFTQMTFELKRLLNTFAGDYVFNNGNTKELTVWVSTGRDQMKVIKRLIDNDYSKNHNTEITLTMTSDITGAVLAGAGPDVCLYLDSEFPVNFATRNVLTDLSEFDGFKEVTSRFEEKMLTPFMLNGKCYALPLTVSYPMLFVRDDILSKLELSVPQTWKDVYTAAAVLQRNHLEIGMPSHVGMFFTFLYQNGGTLFDENLKTTFADQTSLDAFEFWTSFFSKYSFPLSYDFFNRFRSGQMPIGIADYTLYAQLKAAAPEIRDQWSMHQLPGIMLENGDINRNICISGATGTTSNLGLAQSMSTCVIFQACDEKEEAFEFLDWFTSASIQANYGIEIEAELGDTGRYTPANLETLEMLPWTRAELLSLNSARENIIVLPEYPGNYYIAREVNNAFRSVINEKVNAVDVLSRKNLKINKELERKHKQYEITAEEAVQ